MADAKTLKFKLAQRDWAQLFNRELEQLEVVTEGSLKMDVLPTKAVVHRETIDAVANGILDGDMNAIAYFAGRDPALPMGDYCGYDTLTIRVLHAWRRQRNAAKDL